MLNAEEISSLIKEQIKTLQLDPIQTTEGVVMGIADGIVKIYGLANAAYGAKLEFADGTLGIALNLEQDCIGAIVLGDHSNITQGQTVKLCKEVFKIPVGKELIGRVVNALGEPIDGGPEITTTLRAPIEKIAPGVIWRKSVLEPLQTGIKSIDTMVPIGRGQRELIIGDRQTGKTALAIDTIINQKDQGMICIYVAIGQKASSVALLVKKLTEYHAMQHTIVVVATAAEAAALQYIAPFTGCSMGEYFRDRGEDALIIYDDLTKHAWAYRQISLLLKRPPGREAYPGDIFYLHSRLLERAARVNEEFVAQQSHGQITNRTGSLTALPIIETQAGDVSAFVPTNVISITDGQIFLDTDLFKAGIRPAINAGLSVSRVGGAAQTPIIKQLGIGVRLMLAQYRELAAFAQFASELDQATSLQLARGQRVTEIMKQTQFNPICVGLMAISLFAVCHGSLDDLPLQQIAEFEQKLHTYVKLHYASFLQELDLKCNLDQANEDLLSKIMNEFKNKQFITN